VATKGQYRVFAFDVALDGIVAFQDPEFVDGNACHGRCGGSRKATTVRAVAIARVLEVVVDIEMHCATKASA